MTNREFTKLLKSVTANSKAAASRMVLDQQKMCALPDDAKRTLIGQMVRRRWAVPADLLPADKQFLAWLHSCAYLYRSRSASGLIWLHTSENKHPSWKSIGSGEQTNGHF